MAGEGGLGPASGTHACHARAQAVSFDDDHDMRHMVAEFGGAGGCVAPTGFIAMPPAVRPMPLTMSVWLRPAGPLDGMTVIANTDGSQTLAELSFKNGKIQYGEQGTTRTAFRKVSAGPAPPREGVEWGGMDQTCH